MSLVSSANILNFLNLSADDSYGTIAAIHAGVEKSIKAYCGRDLESTTYKELYSGSGNQELILRQYPIISVQRISIGREPIITVKNTNQFTSASVSVTSTNVVLTLDGGSSTSLAIATYTTATTMVDAINAVGSGWVAELVNSTYATYKTRYLFAMGGKEVIDSQWVYLNAPWAVTIDYDDIHPVMPIITKYDGWPTGTKNIYVDYTAGYATIPDDLQYAVKIMVKSAYSKHQECSFGVGSYSIAGMTKSFEGIGVNSYAPVEAMQVLDSYRRKSI